jgi:hypothetical protein
MERTWGLNHGFTNNHCLKLEAKLRELPFRLTTAILRLMNATAERLDNYLREADPATADDQGMAALERIAARGGIAGIADPAAWEREQRAAPPGGRES